MTEVQRYSFAGTPGLYVHEVDFDALQRRLEAIEARCAEQAALLEVWQTWLGASRNSCDETGKLLWDRIEAALAQSAPATNAGGGV